jgi:hypothetical protein
MRSICVALAVVSSILIAAPRVSAQVHVAGQETLDAAVQQHVGAVDQDRETIRVFLQRDDIRAIAGKYGVDIRRAENGIAAMNEADLASTAAKVRQANEALAGGQSTVTISLTTIIIVLLVLILLIVALR